VGGGLRRDSLKGELSETVAPEKMRLFDEPPGVGARDSYAEAESPAIPFWGCRALWLLVSADFYRALESLVAASRSMTGDGKATSNVLKATSASNFADQRSR